MRSLSRRDGLFLAVYSERTRDKERMLREVVQTGYMENLLHHDDSQAGLQVAQRGWAVAVLGGFQNRSRKGPEQPGLAW